MVDFFTGFGSLHCSWSILTGLKEGLKEEDAFSGFGGGDGVALVFVVVVSCSYCCSY